MTTPSLSPIFQQYSSLFVQQRKEWAEILIDWETSNKYAVLDEQKNEVAWIAERSGGIGTQIKRWFLRSHRGFVVDVFDREKKQILQLWRPFFFLFSDLQVAVPYGDRVGSIHRRFGILYKKYDLKDRAGRLFATVSSPRWRLWTFPIKDLSGEVRATVSKRWGGGLRETLTDADTFRIDFGTHPWTPEQRAILFALALSIDFDFFENNQGVSSLWDLIPFGD